VSKSAIDVEQLDRTVSPSLVEAALAPAERATLATLPLEMRRVAFLRLWTMKEAVLKNRWRRSRRGSRRLGLPT
jgi:phosphopantetheinyl transferase